MVSELSDAMNLAVRAMLLVGAGSGERSAVQRVISLEPGLAPARRQALNLVIGTLVELDLLDVVIDSTLQSNTMSKETRSLLRLATHLLLRTKSSESLLHLQKALRSFASVNEYYLVELLIGKVPTVELDLRTKQLADSSKLAMETHLPRWWVEYCIRAFGRNESVKLLTASPRPKYVRVNPLRNRGRSTIPTKLKGIFSAFAKVEGALPVYYLKSSPSRLASFFSEGILQIQDLASFLAVKAAEPIPGEKVLDLCAAPGGKTATLAQFMKNRGMIVSVDYSKARMESWKRETSRLGVKIAEPIICSAEDLSLREKFDLVFIDPPCTGTGILDRNPSMKWRLSPELMTRYSRLQSQFLDSAAEVVAKCGRILYCTCSLTLEENEHVVRAFLKSHLDFETRTVLSEYGTAGLEGFEDCRRFWPDRDKTAGYFVARLQHLD